MKISLDSFVRPWDTREFWVTRYRSRPGNLFFQIWIGNRGWVLLVQLW